MFAAFSRNHEARTATWENLRKWGRRYKIEMIMTAFVVAIMGAVWYVATPPIEAQARPVQYHYR